MSSPHDAASPFSLTRREKVFTIFGTLLGLLLAALDQTIVATAGPVIQRELHVPPALYPWITSAYLVASTVMVPIYGKLSDLYGRKPILLCGIVLFLLGSLACGASTTTFALLAARALQGFGSAALFTSAFAVVADIFPPAERGRYQGIFGACFALSSIVGPLVGGFLTDRLSWHWVFFVNLPLGAIAIAFVVAKMPLLRRPRVGRPSIDWTGAIALACAVLPALLAMSLGRSYGADPSKRPILVGLLAASVAGLVLFLRIERRAKEPILDLRLFSRRAFTIGNLATFVLGAAFLGAIVFLPLYMVNVIGLSATNAGLTVIPLTFGIVGGNILSGQLVARFARYKPLMVISNVVLVVGMALLGFTLRPDETEFGIGWRMVVLGLGLGPSIPLYTLAIQTAVEPRDLGVATAAATFFRQIGSTIGVTVLGVVFATSLGAGLARNPPPPVLAAEVAQLGSGSATEEGDSRMHVDVPRLSAILDATIGDPAERARAQGELLAWDRATKAAFTDAIAAIYKAGLVIAILGLLCTLALPELPLRRSGERRVSAGE
jgi:EmrB/QacA subfamily drug resistance transporter